MTKWRTYAIVLGYTLGLLCLCYTISCFATAQQTNADAEFNRGLSYDEHQGVPQDSKETAMWYATAAEQGVRYSRFPDQNLNSLR